MTENFFNLDDLSQGIARNLADGVSTRIFPGDQAMLSVVRVEPDSYSDEHSHTQEQWGVILEGGGVRIQDGKEYIVSAGDFWRTPGDIVHAFRAGSNGAKLLDIFSPPRDEYRAAGSGVGSEGA
ncbi:MAG: cupin domain-containing protein [Acidiferrobacteraceae bacterium]|jgi:quercetin dioxygenase-like cupin family protein|nr:cupin domain-containing protein [Acidiferrobacteraceae bacterium]MBT3972537.1 cupin domain-containing protein [Acidiferrobacteraceae bacterium]MBT5982195.1 cupin domain-containing protein [Acidiferrobacteraceae bacterium]MBT6732259.1 cupin domain-containing protein [Acidiferrobacteraceae bacterium]MBT7518233.1 cupin domain-containing protein [Acidiferrobacteraceae bacterium]